MRPARLLVYSLLPLFAACQVWKPESPSTSVDTVSYTHLDVYKRQSTSQLGE